MGSPWLYKTYIKQPYHSVMFHMSVKLYIHVSTQITRNEITPPPPQTLTHTHFQDIYKVAAYL